MAQVCEVCGRRKQKAISRSHSNIATKRYQHLNLQTINIDGRTVRGCTQCIKNHTKSLSQSGKQNKKN
ncbi:bL28 family ribosomal protein [Patescibacteria group bacterium]